MTRFLLTVALCCLVSAPAAAQYGDTPPLAPAESGRTATPTPAPPAPKDAITITVVLKHGDDGRAISDTPVFLQAARPRGPFEPTAPRPQFEWTAMADANGVAKFTQVPRDLTTSGLRVHAASTYDGLAFNSPPSAPLDGSTLEVTVWEKGLDPSVVAIQNLRTVVEVWENYVVFTQYYTLTNDGKTALDVKLLPDEDYDKGLPFELPVKAQGINVSGPGESMVVNSTFYWKGVLEPGARANLQVRFSMSAHDPEFTYEQTMGYRTGNVEVVVPIQTKFEKMPRLEALELRPLGFSESDKGAGIFGLRDDVDFVGARGLELKSGQSFTFQLRGLPFHRAKLPWAFLVLGLICGFVVVVFASRARKQATSQAGRTEILEQLRAQREAVLEELVAVEKDLAEGVLTTREAEFESTALRAQLALVLKQLEDLESAGK